MLRLRTNDRRSDPTPALVKRDTKRCSSPAAMSAYGHDWGAFAVVDGGLVSAGSMGKQIDKFE